MSGKVTKIEPVGPIGAPKTPCECLADITELMDALSELNGSWMDGNILAAVAKKNEERKLSCPVIYGHGTGALNDTLEYGTTFLSTTRLRKMEDGVKSLLPLEWLVGIILSIEGEGSSMTVDDDERDAVMDDIQKRPYRWMASDALPVECIKRMTKIFDERTDIDGYDIETMDDLEVIDRRRQRLVEQVDEFFDYCEPAKPVFPTIEKMDEEIGIDISEDLIEYRRELEEAEKDAEELRLLMDYEVPEFDKDRKEEVYKLETGLGEIITYTPSELMSEIEDADREVSKLIDIVDMKFITNADDKITNHLEALKIMLEAAMWPNCKDLRWKR